MNGRITNEDFYENGQFYSREVTFYDRVQDKLADDEGNRRENHYEVIGVWLDGNPQVLASNLTYAEAVKLHAEKEYAKRVHNLGGGVPIAPFYGICDTDDYERGYGPWED